MPTPVLPIKAKTKATQVTAQRNAAADEFDVTWVTEDGRVLHVWYRGKLNGWNGPETIFEPDKS